MLSLAKLDNADYEPYGAREQSGAPNTTKNQEAFFTQKTPYAEVWVGLVEGVIHDGKMVGNMLSPSC